MDSSIVMEDEHGAEPGSRHIRCFQKGGNFMLVEENSRQTILSLELKRLEKAIREKFKTVPGISKEESRLQKQLCREEIKKLRLEFAEENKGTGPVSLYRV